MGEVSATGPASHPSLFKPLPFHAPKITATVHMLGEQKLLGILGEYQVPSVTHLDSMRKAKVLALIPLEQEYSDQTPNVNIAIEEKRRRDLENICKNPIYRNSLLNVALPNHLEIRAMSREAVGEKLTELTQRVAAMMSDVAYPYRLTPHQLLRDPIAMAELLGTVPFSPLLKHTSDELFRAKDDVIRDISMKGNALISAIATLGAASENAHIYIPKPIVQHYQQALKIQKTLSSTTTPEDFQKLCCTYAHAIGVLASDRLTLIKNLRQNIKSTIEDINVKIPIEYLPSLEDYLEGPALGDESRWLSMVPQLSNILLPSATLLTATQNFLAPYLERRIVSENEYVAFLQAMQQHLASYFVEKNITLEECETFLAATRPFLLRFFKEKSLSQEETTIFVRATRQFLSPYFAMGVGQEAQARFFHVLNQFLAPYIEKGFIPEREDVQRPEMKDWLIPRLPAEHMQALEAPFLQMPQTSSSQNPIEYLLLSAYLKIVSKGVNLQALENSKNVHLVEANTAKQQAENAEKAATTARNLAEEAKKLHLHVQEQNISAETLGLLAQAQSLLEQVQGQSAKEQWLLPKERALFAPELDLLVQAQSMLAKDQSLQALEQVLITLEHLMLGLEKALHIQEERLMETTRQRHKKAEEIQEAINSYVSTVTLSLAHSLRIDFKSMNLTDQEIAYLGRETLFKPSIPLPFNWRERIAHG